MGSGGAPEPAVAGERTGWWLWLIALGAAAALVAYVAFHPPGWPALPAPATLVPRLDKLLPLLRTLATAALVLTAAYILGRPLARPPAATRAPEPEARPPGAPDRASDAREPANAAGVSAASTGAAGRAGGAVDDRALGATVAAVGAAERSVGVGDDRHSLDATVASTGAGDRAHGAGDGANASGVPPAVDGASSALVAAVAAVGVTGRVDAAGKESAAGAIRAAVGVADRAQGAESDRNGLGTAIATAGVADRGEGAGERAKVSGAARAGQGVADLGEGGGERAGARGVADGDRVLGVLIALGAGFLVLSHGVLVLALLSRLTPAWLWALVVVPAAAGAILAGARLLRRRGAPRAPRLPRGEHGGWRSGFVLLLLLGGALLVPWLDPWVPSYGWDALMYHLALPERYLAAQEMFVTPFSICSTYPHAVQMLYTLALGLDGPALAKLLALGVGLLLAATLQRLAGRISRRAGWLAVAILLADPLVQWQLTICYSDLLLAWFTLLALASASAWLDRGTPIWLVRTGLFLGGALSVRWTGGAALVAVCLTLVVCRPTFAATTWRQRVLAALSAAAVAGLVVSPWLLRNALFTGNPVSPLLQGVFTPGREFFDPLVIEQLRAFLGNVGMGKDPLALLALPFNLPMRSRAGLYAGSFGYVVGLAQFAGAAAALALPAVRRRPEAARAAVVIGALTLLWFYTSQEARFLLPAFPPLALLAALAFDDLASRLPRGGARWPRAAALALPAAAVLLAGWSRLGRLGFEWAYALGQASPRALERNEPAARIAETLRRRLPPKSRVLLVMEPRGYLFAGLDYLPDVVNEASPVMAWIHRAPSVTALRCALPTLGVTHLVVNLAHVERHPSFVAGYAPTDYQSTLAKLRTLLQTGADVLAEDSGVVAAALRPPTGCR